MNRLITTNNGGMPLDLDDLRFQMGQDTYAGNGVIDAFAGILKDLVPVNGNLNFVVSGCLLAVGGSNFSCTKGWVMVDDDGSGDYQLVRVEAQTIGAGGADAYLVITDSWNADGSDTFQNGDTVNTYRERRGILTRGTGVPSTAVPLQLESNQFRDLKSIVGGGLATKRLDIGTWDMNATASVTVAHGLTFTKIRKVTVEIVNDAISNIYPIDVFSTGPGSVNGQWSIDATDILLTRLTGGLFDASGFATTPTPDGSVTRGWITIEYEI